MINYIPPNTWPNVASNIFLYDDFLTSPGPAIAAIFGETGLTANLSGTGTAVNTVVTLTSQNPGVLAMISGTTTTGNAGIRGDVRKSLLLGSGIFSLEWCSGLSALSNGTDRYTVRGGITPTPLSGAPTDGIFFSYADNVNSGNWVCNCANASSTTSTNTSVAATTAFQKFKFVVNAAATSVEFFINDVSVATIITNIPATTTSVSHCWAINKALGTTSTSYFLDYYALLLELTTSR